MNVTFLLPHFLYYNSHIYDINSATNCFLLRTFSFYSPKNMKLHLCQDKIKTSSPEFTRKINFGYDKHNTTQENGY